MSHRLSSGRPGKSFRKLACLPGTNWDWVCSSHFIANGMVETIILAPSFNFPMADISGQRSITINGISTIQILPSFAPWLRRCCTWPTWVWNSFGWTQWPLCGSESVRSSGFSYRCCSNPGSRWARIVKTSRKYTSSSGLSTHCVASPLHQSCSSRKPSSIPTTWLHISIDMSVNSRTIPCKWL